MPDEVDLLAECMKGLGITSPPEDIEKALKQKLLAVKGFMLGSGVSKEKMHSDLGVGVVVMGVTDLWELESGKVKFSPAFFTLVTQLSMG